MDEVLIGVQELSRRYGLPTSWIYAKAEAQQIPHLKIGKYVRFRPSEVSAWIEAQRRGPRVEVAAR
jgi:excisionase family DNA binding protein